VTLDKGRAKSVKPAKRVLPDAEPAAGPTTAKRHSAGNFQQLKEACVNVAVGEAEESLLPDWVGRSPSVQPVTTQKLGATLKSFETRHPGWALAVFDMSPQTPAGVQNAVSAMPGEEN